MDQLKEWIATLSDEQKDKIILDLIDFAIDAEFVGIYEGTVPYYDSTGEALDGTDR